VYTLGTASIAAVFRPARAACRKCFYQTFRPWQPMDKLPGNGYLHVLVEVLSGNIFVTVLTCNRPPGAYGVPHCSRAIEVLIADSARSNKSGDPIRLGIVPQNSRRGPVSRRSSTVSEDGTSNPQGRERPK